MGRLGLTWLGASVEDVDGVTVGLDVGVADGRGVGPPVGCPEGCVLGGEVGVCGQRRSGLIPVLRPASQASSPRVHDLLHGMT